MVLGTSGLGGVGHMREEHAAAFFVVFGLMCLAWLVVLVIFAVVA